MNALPLPLDIAAKARSDIAEICYYFAQHAPEVESRFYLAFDKTVQQLLRSPALGERCRFRSLATKSMRIWQVDGFSNYLIFYRQGGDQLEILRVLHGARDYETMFNEE